MKCVLEIRTFGGLVFTCNGEPLTPALSRKARALLVYLACEARPCTREFLAELLWPERSQTQSLSNLRKLLMEIRQLATPWVHATRESIMITPDTCWVDVAELEMRLAQGERPRTDGHLSNPASDRLETALALYKGDFLEGFYSNSEDFDAWVNLERERLRFSVTQVLDWLTEVYIHQDNTRAGLTCIARLAQIDSLREKTYQQAMRLYAQAGQREAALRQFETCQELLQQELGITPSPETVDLYENIRAGRFSNLRPQGYMAQARPNHNLPTQATTFIGRQKEVQELLERLEDPECRLLTIGGPGGIGKTRLALEVAQRVTSRYVDGICFVPLAAIRNNEAMVSAILASLAIRIPENDKDLSAFLLHHLASKAMLLVLDNMEHLLDDLDLVQAILATAPHIKLLVTSRQPLAIRWEWYFALQGMQVPVGISSDQPETYSSIQLFVERARRVRNSFMLADDSAGVIRICELVEGMPLGIELAATWVRLMSCQEIAEQIIELETPYQQVEARHKSLQALFENTWLQLSSREQRLLMQLSVFRGGFTVTSATDVVGSTLPDLALLVHKSLISVNYHTNRYEFHQLLKEFMREKLSALPNDEQQALDSHSRYFIEFLQGRENDLRGGQPQVAIEAIQMEIDNVRAAWQHAVENQHFDWIERGCVALNSFYALKVLHHEALTVFRHALDALHAESQPTNRDRVELALQTCLIAPLTAVYGWENHILWPVAERIRELAECMGDNQQLLASLILLVNLYANEEWEKAVEVGQEAVKFSQQLGKQSEMAAHVLNEIPLIFTGRLWQALEHSKAAQALFDPDDCLWATITYGMDPLVISLAHEGITLTLLGYADQGLYAVTKAQARAEALGQPFSTAFAIGFTASCYMCTRTAASIISTAQRLADLGAEHGFKHWLVFAPCFQAVGLILQGDYEEGIALLGPSIQQEQAIGLTHNLPVWYAYLGYAYAQIGRLEQGFIELNHGITEMNRVGERYHESCIYRLRGEMLLLGNDAQAAAASFEQAIIVAQQQHSKFYELQATLSLYDLLRRDDRRNEAFTRLRAIYDWFTEGLACPDLIQARALLQDNHRVTN